MSRGLEVAGDPDAPRIAWFVHGILGRGRNLRSLASKVTQTWPDFRVLLPDLRCHGDAPASSPPHDLAAVGRDLAALAAQHGAPTVVVGHSFGGKAILTWARDSFARGTALWALDSPPGAVDRAGSEETSADPARILSLLQGIAVPVPDRDALRRPLKAAGLPEGIVQWLLTSAHQASDGWRWSWDLDGVESMLRSYASSDLWPFLETTSLPVRLVRAGRSDRWSERDLAGLAALPQGGPVVGHLLPAAGHWLHVDDPVGLWALMRESFEGASLPG